MLLLGFIGMSGLVQTNGEAVLDDKLNSWF